MSGDPDAAARAHKAAGGHVVGYLCDNVPTELIAAAGAFPLRIRGGTGVDPAPVRRFVDTLYPPDVSRRPPFVAAMLGRILAGGYDFLDAIVVPHNRNAVQAIHRELHDAAAEHGIAVPRTLYLDKAWAPGDAARAFDRAALERLGGELAALTGRPITEAALAAAIATGNRRRRALAALGERRRARPSRLPGSLAYRLIAESFALPDAQAADLLETVADADAPPVRLYLGGSPQDHGALYAAVERCGATIVAEDHCWGDRGADLPVDETLPPFEALAARFHALPACAIRFPLDAVRRSVVERARRAEVDGAILFVTEGDQTQAWETPGQVAALGEAGMPVLHLMRQPHAADGAALEARLAAFVADLRR